MTPSVLFAVKASSAAPSAAEKVGAEGVPIKFVELGASVMVDGSDGLKVSSTPPPRA